MLQVEIKNDERIDELVGNKIRIIQSNKLFSFSIDAVLLARFASIPAKGKILDLCTGNGVIPLIMADRTKLPIIGIDIQEKIVDLAKRSIKLNNLEEQISIFHLDLREAEKVLGVGKFELITVNPPYLPPNSGDRNENIYQAIARHEIMSTLEDVIQAASKLVKFGGKLAIVHRPFRLAELISLLKKYNFEPKRMRFVYPNVKKEANMILLEAIYHGKTELRVMPPLIIHDHNGEYTDEIKDIYSGIVNIN